MNPLQNPVTLTRLRLLRRTVAPPIAVLTALIVFGLLANYLFGEGPYCYECDPARIVWRKAEDAIMSFVLLQGLVAVLGPMVFGAGFHFYDKRSGVADATQMSPFSTRKRLLGEVMGIAALPLAVLACFGAAAVIPVAMGPIPLGGTFVATQLVLVGLTLISASLVARSLCSTRNMLGVALLFPLLWLAAMGADHATWSLPRIVVGAELFGFVGDITRWQGSTTTQPMMLWIYVAGVLSTQAAALFAMLGVNTPHTNAGMRRTVGLVAVFAALQVGVFALFSSDVAAQAGVHAEIFSYHFEESLVFFWLLGFFGAVSLVTLLMPSAEQRYRSSLRASLGSADLTRPNVYVAGIGVLALGGAALIAISLLTGGELGARHAPPSGAVLMGTLVAMVQLCGMIAYYELLAAKTGARAPVWMVITAVGVTGAVFFAILSGFDETTAAVLPAVAPVVFITDSTPDAEAFVSVIIWLVFGVVMGAAHHAKGRRELTA